MKEGWKYERIGDISLKITDGSHNPPKGIDKSEYLMLSSQNVQDGYLDLSAVRYLSKENFELEHKRTQASSGDVLLTIVGTVGRSCVLKGDEGKITFQRSVAIIKPKDFVNPYYLMYCFRNMTDKLNNEAHGAAQKGLYLKQLSNIIIPLPDKSEQKQIVDFLDAEFAKIDELKNQAEQSLQNAKDLFQAALKEMLTPKEGWEVIPLKNVAKYRRGSFPQPYGKKEWYDGPESMPFVQVADLNEDSFDLVTQTKKKISKIAQPLSVFAPQNTVLVSLQGSIGKVSITQYDSYVDRTVAIFYDYLIDIEKTFFAYQLKTKFAQERLKARGTTIKTITKEEFAEFEIFVPTKLEQIEFVDKISQIYETFAHLTSNYTRTIQLCADLKQALLRQVFE